MHIQRQTETFAYRVATAPAIQGIEGFTDDEESRRRTLDRINGYLSQGQTKAAVETWAASEIPLDEMLQPNADAIKRHINLWGFPDEEHWGENSDYDWARSEYEDYTAARYHASNGAEGYGRLSVDDARLQHPEWYSSNSNNEDDEEDEDQSCPDCDFTTFFDRDMMRHRYLRHDDDDAVDDYYGFSRPHLNRPEPHDPDKPVENTTDPNAKLKSPWYKKVQHYPSGQLPDEFDKRNLYRDFNFGLPGIATDSPQTYFRTDPDQGIYQINDSRRPLHNPPVGYVHYYADHPNKTVKIQYLDVHPKKRGQGVATALVSALAEDFPDYKINPGTTTSHGTGFVDYMRRNAPGAQERLDAESWNPAPANQLTDNQLREWGVQRRRSPVFARIALHNRQVERRRIAALTQDVVDRLKGEFDEWWKGTGEEVPQVKGAWPGRGAIGHWPTIERFLGEKYPAAFKGFNMGHEEVTPMLDRTVYSGDSVFGDLQPEDDCPACFGYGNSGHPDEDCAVCGGDGWANPDALYDSGSKAVARHGYDPSEIAAGMLLLHNESHPFRGGMSDADQERLVDIFQKRQKMQRDYEERQKGLVTAVNKLLLHAQGVLNAQN